MKNRLLQAALAAAGVAIMSWGALMAQSGGFLFHGPRSRVVTPNADGFNDLVIFCFDNPSDSGVSGKIFTLLGANVADTSVNAPVPPATGCPAGSRPQFSFWDGKSKGGRVAGGIYVYQIQAEGAIFTGTLVVVK